MERIGYWLNDKKIKKLRFNLFTEICRNAGLNLVKIDIDQSLESQGPFSLIVHKLNDIIVMAKEGNTIAKQRQQRILDYLKNHPETIVVDPLEKLEILQDRHVQYKFVQECCQNEKFNDFFIPPFVELTSTDVEENKKLMEANNVQFPFVSKHTTSQGAVDSHNMCLVFNEDGLKDIEPPCVVQTFINHNALLYKICMVGNHFSMLRRPSIKNLAAGANKTIFFNSNDVSKPTSQSFLNQVKESDQELPLKEPDLKKLAEFGQAVHRKLGLCLFGIDVIVENHTGKYAVIDINTFPGYDGVSDFYPRLLDLLQEKLRARTLVSDHTAPNIVVCGCGIHTTIVPCQHCQTCNISPNNNILRDPPSSTISNDVANNSENRLSKEERVLNELNTLSSSIAAPNCNSKEGLPAQIISQTSSKKFQQNCRQ